MNRLRRYAVWLIAIGLVAITIVCLHQGWRAYALIRDAKPWDGIVDWGGAKMWSEGIDPFSDAALQRVGLRPGWGLAHPPTAFIWFLPVADLDLLTMKAVWDGFTITLLFLYAALLARLQAWRWPELMTVAVFSAVLAMPFMTLHLYLVQLSTLIAFLCLWSYFHLERGEDFLAGLLLGAALTLKFYPGVIVVAFLVLRRFRVVIGATAGWLVFAIPVTCKLGIRGWRDFFRETDPYLRRWMWHIRNASIQGVVQRFAHPVCENSPENPSNLPAWRFGEWLASGLSLSLVVVSLVAVRRFVKRTGRWDIPLALLTTISLITGPYTWEHYRVTLIFPLAVLACECIRKGSLRRRIAIGLPTVLSAWLISRDTYEQEGVWSQWLTTHDPALHFRLHLLEVENWIPYWLIAGALLALLFTSRERQSTSAIAAAASAASNNP